MAQVISDRRDIDFNLYELFNTQELCSHDRFKKFNKKAFSLILTEARNFALTQMLSTYRDGDAMGVSYENGEVKVPESFHRVYKLYCENQWNSLVSDPNYGGQGLPNLIAVAVREYMMGANWPIYAYGTLGTATGTMIRIHGTKDQKQTYVRNLYTGKWGGTMLLTEPEAGTDVGSLTTTAVENKDGTYSLTGNKIFITNGEHDLCENIIHPVLARIKGDPPGIRGISIFIVPKYLVGSDGKPGERNDIACTGIEDKHGLHGSATCSMSLGSRGSCVGYLLGERGKGIEVMFNMINLSRVSVSTQALSYGSSAYLFALSYARNRIQGRDIKNLTNHEAPPVPIIRHPDVKRNLLEMKAYTEGIRSLIYFVMSCLDRSSIEPDKEQKEKLYGFAELLTPVIKGYGCEINYQVCVKAIQVFGGAGYIREYPVESIARDCKITTIYEGTTGIQAIDLISRKLFMKNGKLLTRLLEEIKSVICQSADFPDIKSLSVPMKEALACFKKTALGLKKDTKSMNYRTAFSHTTLFLEAMGDICVAWMLLKRAVVASDKLRASPGPGDMEFYRGQIHTACFFIRSLIPVTMGKLASIEARSTAVVEISEEAFGGL